jgi:hypothetical protein
MCLTHTINWLYYLTYDSHHFWYIQDILIPLYIIFHILIQIMYNELYQPQYVAVIKQLKKHQKIRISDTPSSTRITS